MTPQEAFGFDVIEFYKKINGLFRVEPVVELEDKLELMQTALQMSGLISYRGRTRVVYLSKNIVIKVPKITGGVKANESEYNRYHDATTNNKPEAKFYAICNMINVWNVPIILMERVDPITSSRNILPFFSHMVDCTQVGKTKDGRLVLYDYCDVM